MIAVIGGAGVAITMKAKLPAEGGTPAPASENDIMAENHGCGFNIAVNLARRGLEVSFATVVGDDVLGMAVKEQLKKEKIDIENVKTAQGASPIRVEIVNVLGDPEFLRVSEAMYEKITPEVAAEWKDALGRAEAIVLDGNLPKETIAYIAGEYGGADGTKIFFDPASPEGAEKATDVLDKLYCIMPGRIEAEVMTRKTILSEEQLAEAGAYFAEKGVSRVFITMKGGGLYYKDGAKEGVLRPERVLSFARTTGAGDVTSAAVIAASVAGKTIEETATAAMDAAAAFLAEQKDQRFVQ